MTDQRNHQIVIINNANLTMGPQIVFPSFRPISLFEIEDDYDNLVHEINVKFKDYELKDELIEFIAAFKGALDDKSIEPLIQYFIINHAGRFDINQAQAVFRVLGQFINEATDETRLMN